MSAQPRERFSRGTLAAFVEAEKQRCTEERRTVETVSQRLVLDGSIATLEKIEKRFGLKEHKHL